MKLFIVAVGHKMPDWVNQGFHEYAKRLPNDFKIELREIKPELRTNNKNTQQILATEYTKILNAIPKQATIVVLDEKGASLTTEQFADSLKEWQNNGQDIAFVIGSADGLSEDLKKQAHQQLRLSHFTLPHGMTRVVLAEQIYRAWSILQRHPYHRI